VSQNPAGGLGPPIRCRRLGGFKALHQVAEGLAIEGFLFDQLLHQLVEQVTAGTQQVHRLIQGLLGQLTHLRINLPAG